VSDGLLKLEQIFDATMIETPGGFVEKRKALLDAFGKRAPDGELTPRDHRQAWPLLKKAAACRAMGGPEAARRGSGRRLVTGVHRFLKPILERCRRIGVYIAP
jgi:hypothetical protein